MNGMLKGVDNVIVSVMLDRPWILVVEMIPNSSLALASWCFSSSASRSEDHTHCRVFARRPALFSTRGSLRDCSYGIALVVRLSVYY
jgi:hypothetical protein